MPPALDRLYTIASYTIAAVAMLAAAACFIGLLLSWAGVISGLL